eukprot:17389-Heterococcus_DN1.PRE.2
MAVVTELARCARIRVVAELTSMSVHRCQQCRCFSLWRDCMLVTRISAMCRGSSAVHHYANARQIASMSHTLSNSKLFTADASAAQLCLSAPSGYDNT